MPLRARWQRISLIAEFVSTPSRRARCGRRSIRLTKKVSRWRISAATPQCDGQRNQKKLRRLTFLAAPSCSSYITGEILPIIGGYSGG
jgi:hypothetical protein